MYLKRTSGDGEKLQQNYPRDTTVVFIHAGLWYCGRNDQVQKDVWKSCPLCWTPWNRKGNVTNNFDEIKDDKIQIYERNYSLKD